MFDSAYAGDLFATTKPGTIRERFDRFHQENPHVYRELTRLALEAKRLGYKRWSIKGAYEVLRWSALKTTGEEFKLNDHYTALYARLIMENEPDLAGFFETRTRKAV